MERMTQEQAKKAIRLICTRFLAPVPQLQWDGRQRNGRAWLHIIKIGPNCWRGAETTMIHEISHVIAMHHNGVRTGHGPVFWKVLESVAAVWYGDASLYPWHTEYRAGKSYAGRRKLLKK